MRRTIAALAVIIGALLGMPAAATPERAERPLDGCEAGPAQIMVSVDTKTATAEITLTCTLAGLSVTIPVEITASGQNCELPVVEAKPGPTPVSIEFTGTFACAADVEGKAGIAQVATASPPLNQGRLKLDITSTCTLEAAVRIETTTKLAFSLKVPGTPAVNPKWLDTNTVTADAKVGTTAVLNVLASTTTKAEVQVDKDTTTTLSFGI